MANYPKRNSEGYYDPTAYEGMKSIVREENALDGRVSDLVRVLKFIIRNCGFELVSRIEIKDVKICYCECKNKELQERLSAIVAPVQCDTYAEAVRAYGKQSQLVMAMEEMSELTKELSKNLRGADNSKALAEEIADVEIMLEQLKVIFRNRALVDRIRANKLVRLSDRITGEVRE